MPDCLFVYKNIGTSIKVYILFLPSRYGLPTPGQLVRGQACGRPH